MTRAALRPLLLPPLLAALLSGACQPRAPAPGAAVEGAPRPLALPGAATSVELPEDSPMLAMVRLEAADERALATDEVVSPAKIEIDPSRLSHVLLPVTGRVTEVDVRVGDHVHAGDVLLQLDSPEAGAAIAHFEQSEGDRLAAKAALIKATADLERVRGLYLHDAVARKELDNVEAAHAEARASVLRAEADRRQALRRLQLLGLRVRGAGDTVAVRAPISGIVLELHVAPGEFRSDMAQPLITIADLSRILVTADVPENAIRRVALGEPVEIELVAYPGEVFSAEVVRIADRVEPSTRTVEVHADLPNPQGRFRPEMFGRMRHSESTASMPTVPQSAVLARHGQDLVLVERGRGRFEVRPVKIRARAGDRVGLASGVRAGERVVSDGGLLLLPPE